jgi:flagellar protein FlaI
MYDLLQAALRQRPEYLLVGEIRTEERVALSFFQAMAPGHTAYTTVHADSVQAAINRLKNPPLNVPTQMLQELDIVSIQGQTFLDEQRVRRNRVVAEIETGAEDVEIHDVFRRDAASDTHERVGESRVMSEIARERGWSDEELREELDNRRAILTYLAENDMTDYDVVARTIHLYSRNPNRLMERVTRDDLTSEDLEAVTPDIEELTPAEFGISDSFMGQ